MALAKTVDTVHGFQAVNAYHRVEGIRFVDKDKMVFHVRASLDGVKPHFGDEQHECAYDITGDNPIKQAYKYLKSLPEFSGAMDC